MFGGLCPNLPGCIYVAVKRQQKTEDIRKVTLQNESNTLFPYGKGRFYVVCNEYRGHPSAAVYLCNLNALPQLGVHDKGTRQIKQVVGCITELRGMYKRYNGNGLF